MRILDNHKGVNRFFSRLSTRPRRVLLLDYDGTLAPFRARRMKALPYPGVRQALADIARQPRNRVVVVSGRSVAEVLFLLQPKRLLEVWGCHGAERMLPDGAWRRMALPLGAQRQLSRGAKWVDEMGWLAHLEKKPYGIALHWRGLEPDLASLMRDSAMGQWGGLGPDSGVELLTFDGGVELRASGADKGRAVRAVLEEEGEEACLAYLGDDITDEDAFQAIKGRGLGVLVRKELRPTAAELWLRPPEELMRFLGDWHEIGRGNLPKAPLPSARRPKADRPPPFPTSP